MRLITKRRKKGKLILKVVLLAFVIYVISLLVSQQVLIQNKKNKLQQLTEQKVLQKIKNENLENALKSSSEDNNHQIEKIARELGYAKNGETIFEVTKGNSK